MQSLRDIAILVLIAAGVGLFVTGWLSILARF
jgi:hypothetical protein